MSGSRSKNTLVVQCKEEETDEKAISRAYLSPELQSAMTATQCAKGAFSNLGLSDLVCILEEQAAKSASGDMALCETTLVAQVTTLDLVFHELLRTSLKCLETNPDMSQAYLKLALRSQSQCRATIESLVAVKKPPEPIRQTNIAHGHQQVNNFPQNELMDDQEVPDGERLDAATAGAAIDGDKKMGAVGEKYRA